MYAIYTQVWAQLQATGKDGISLLQHRWVFCSLQHASPLEPLRSPLNWPCILMDLSGIHHSMGHPSLEFYKISRISEKQTQIREKLYLKCCIYSISTETCKQFCCSMPQIAKFTGPTWGPPRSCRPKMGPMLAPSTLLSGDVSSYMISL